MGNSRYDSVEGFRIKGIKEVQFKELKSKYAKLSDNDLKYELEDEAKLIKRIQSRMNKNHTEVIRLIKKTMPKNN